ncbi:MAG: IS66 family insertion sequence element accessory protein TnpA [Limnochordia bacterium]|mgnify:FL=1
MTKEARQELRELWAERVEAFLASGLSQRAWCREHGLKQERLSYWLRKFRAEASAKPNGRWLQLDSLAPSGSGVSLRIGGLTLEVQRGFDPQVLADVISSLMNLC